MVIWSILWAIWSILRPFGLFYSHLVYFIAILVNVIFGHLVYFMIILYILWKFGIFVGHLDIFSRFGILNQENWLPC
jgi:hypothetical protein